MKRAYDKNYLVEGYLTYLAQELDEEAPYKDSNESFKSFLENKPHIRTCISSYEQLCGFINSLKEMGFSIEVSEEEYHDIFNPQEIKEELNDKIYPKNLKSSSQEEKIPSLIQPCADFLVKKDEFNDSEVNTSNLLFWFDQYPQYRAYIDNYREFSELIKMLNQEGFNLDLPSEGEYQEIFPPPQETFSGDPTNNENHRNQQSNLGKRKSDINFLAHHNKKQKTDNNPYAKTTDEARVPTSLQR